MSALQTAIAGLQTAETALVQAVKSYNGSVAGKANESMRNALASEKTIKSKVDLLRSQIEDDGQSLILDWEYDVAIVNGEAKRLSEVVDFTRSTGGGRIGPDGKYEWIPATRTNYVPWSHDHGKWPASSNISAEKSSTVVTTAVAKGAEFWKYEKVTTATSAGRAINLGTLPAGFTTCTIVLRGTETGNVVTVGVYTPGNSSENGGPWGSMYQGEGKIISGPGVISKSGGGLMQVSGLSKDGDTVLSFTRTLPVATGASIYVYPGGVGSTTVGYAVLVGPVQVEPHDRFTGFIETSGALKTFTANTPRITYDPVTGECLGLLVEEQRTNYVTNSSNVLGVGWQRPNATVSGSSAEGQLVTYDTSAAYIAHPCTSTAAIQTATTRVKKGTVGSLVRFAIISVKEGWNGAGVFVDLSTGAVVDTHIGGTGYTLLSSRVTPHNDGSFEISVTVQGPSETKRPIIDCRGEDKIYVAGANLVHFFTQLEAGAFPTSYIPTNGAAVTRASDIAEVEVGGWFNPSEGTVVTAYDFIDGTAAGTGYTYPGSLRQPSRLITLGCYDKGRPITQRPFTQVSGYVGFTDESSKIGYTYDRSGRVSVANQEGTLQAGSMKLAMDTTSLLIIATNAAYTRTYSGHVRSIEYHPRALSEAELQELTA